MNCTSISDRLITKLAHDLLPVGKLAHQYQSYYEHQCPSCGAGYEGRRHLALCEGESRQRWKASIWKEARLLCGKMNVDEGLAELLAGFLGYYFADCNIELAAPRAVAEASRLQQGSPQQLLAPFAKHASWQHL